jgi:hypothetical protein
MRKKYPSVREQVLVRFEVVFDDGWWKFRDRIYGTFLESNTGHIGYRKQEQAQKALERFPF